MSPTIHSTMISFTILFVHHQLHDRKDYAAPTTGVIETTGRARRTQPFDHRTTRPWQTIHPFQLGRDRPFIHFFIFIPEIKDVRTVTFCAPDI